MRIGILSLNQSVNDSPLQYISKTKAKSYVSRGTHRKVSKCLIQELAANVTLSSDPARHAIPKLKIIKVLIPQLNPPSPPMTLNLFYPVTDHSSFRERNFAEIWGCKLEQWQRRMGAN